MIDFNDRPAPAQRESPFEDNEYRAREILFRRSLWGFAAASFFEAVAVIARVIVRDAPGASRVLDMLHLVSLGVWLTSMVVVVVSHERLFVHLKARLKTSVGDKRKGR